MCSPPGAAAASVDLYENGLERVRPEVSYTVAVNAVLSVAKRFPAFARGSDRQEVGTDLEAFGGLARPRLSSGVTG